MRTRRLIVVTPEGERELLFIGRITAGRAPECDISIADTKISRRHAEFDASGPVPRVVDLGSRNGILVNGRKVGSADLAPGDVVTVGDARIRFEEVVAAAPARAAATPQTDDRTAVIAPPSPSPAARPAAPPMPAVPSVHASTPPDRTSVLAAPAMAPAAAPMPAAVAAPETSDRTMVLPPPRVSAPAATQVTPPVVEPPAVSSAAPPPIPAPPVAGSAPRPTPPGPLPGPPSGPPSGPAPAVGPVMGEAVTTPAGRAIPLEPAPAPAAAPAAAAATGAALRGPRFTWGGLLTLSVVALGSLAVLLGALPLMSASSSAIDALSQRQARTLAGWLAAGVRTQSTTVVSPEILEAVAAQPGVEQAMVLDRATGRAIAPAPASGRTFASLPGIGEGWRSLASPAVGRTDTFIDAYVPAGNGAYVAWVRYQGSVSSDSGLAVMVALLATLVFAMLIALLVRRHTRATLQFFTRQVELAVSGAPAKVMQGGLMPGLERLPGVVSYLLEQRHKAPAQPGHGAGSGPVPMDGDAPAAPDVVRDPGPPWIEVTPSLMVADASAHGPASGASSWGTGKGRHLLDVLDNGPMRNAVVQGLGALGMQAGADAAVPLGDMVIRLRREASGHVRVTLEAR